MLSKETRVDRKVFAIVDFPNFAFGIFVVFSSYYPATVSDSETVFLCPLSSLAPSRSQFLFPNSNATPTFYGRQHRPQP
jgi:hypothetical protein